MCRQLYGTAHQVHQPLPYEEEPCECDEDDDDDDGKTLAPRRSKAKTTSKRNFKSVSMGPVQPTRSPLKSSQAKRSSSSKDLSAWRKDKSAEENHYSDVHDTRLLRRCAFCGKDFKSMSGAHEVQTKQGNERQSAERENFVTAKASSRTAYGQEHNSGGSVEQKSKRELDNSGVKTRNVADDAVGAVASLDPMYESTMHFSKMVSDQGSLGVLKCHPRFREYDLIPATLLPFRPRAIKKEGQVDWNAQGDRVPEPARLRRPQSGQRVRSGSALGRLSASTGNIAATHHQSFGVRGESRPMQVRSQTPCATVTSASAARGRRLTASASTHESSDVSQCRNCRNLYWGRSP
ncbi:hypothetical protein FHG87_010143 [Trinorchestia longiramus]|nr:hypothetical protein FHG87_010143 [Trinorchestia longiramus]